MHIQGHTIHQDLGKDELSTILLPAVDHVTVLIICDIHEGVAGHSGRERTLACLRERYWVVAQRTEIDCILCNCFDCHKVTSKPIKQRQGDLLVEQITLGKPPLLAMGLTVLGHSVSLRHKAMKRYGCLFTCFSYRAVHIKLHSLDTDAFLNAVTRFSARRVPLRRLSPTMALPLPGPIRNSRKHLQAGELDQV